MKKFRVKYEIDIEADDDMSAALEVEQFMVNGHYRPSLVVTDLNTNIEVVIDLEEMTIV
jgi:hypothetical protein